jgi:hypothetical protein
MKWFADDSDMKTVKNLQVPNLVLLGGIAISHENEIKMRAAVEKAKSSFGNKRLPVKWNFKDLKRKYDEQGQSDSYQKIMAEMFNVRRAIFDAIEPIDFSIIISAVLGYCSDKKKLTDLKIDLFRHVFSNGLMRFAQHVKESRETHAEVVLDWPDSSISKPFDVEYACAYSNGKSKDGIKYMSGSLESIGFNDSVSYTRMAHSTLMQVSDMIVGTSREFIQHALDEEKTGHGIKLLSSVAKKFRGYPENVIGRGISVNTKATKTRDSIAKKFSELYVQNS